MSELTQNKPNGMATASMVLGILSIVFGFFGWLGIICGILAIIFAVVAKNKIKTDPAMAHSAGKAKGGLIMGIIGIIIGVVIIVLFIMAAKALVEGALNSQDMQDAFRDLENLQKK